MFLSLSIGAVFGVLWGLTLRSRYLDGYYCSGDGSSKLQKACGALGSTAFSAIARYILIAAILALLVIKYSLNVWYWLIGFMLAFWGLVVLFNRGLTRK